MSTEIEIVRGKKRGQKREPLEKKRAEKQKKTMTRNEHRKERPQENKRAEKQKKP